MLVVAWQLFGLVPNGLFKIELICCHPVWGLTGIRNGFFLHARFPCNERNGLALIMVQIDLDGFWDVCLGNEVYLKTGYLWKILKTA